MEVWRLLYTGAGDAYTNMAIDEAVLMAVGRKLVPPTLRLYSWEPSGLSLGFFQPIREIDEMACAEQGITIVRRLTGGRAVLHAHDVTYSVALPADHPLSSGGVLSTYLKLSQALVAGLKLLGVPAELSRRGTRSQRQAACFSVPSTYELVVGNRKLLGSAQVRQAGGVLQHGSLPLDHQAERIISLLRFRDEEEKKKAQAQFRQKATNLALVLGQVPTLDKIYFGLKEGFVTTFDIRFVETDHLSDLEMELCEALKPKYASRSWTARA